MDTREAVFYLQQLKNECKEQHLDEYAEALEMAIDMMQEKDRNRKAWEELIAEERT